MAVGNDVAVGGKHHTAAGGAAAGSIAAAAGLTQRCPGGRTYITIYYQTLLRLEIHNGRICTAAEDSISYKAVAQNIQKLLQMFCFLSHEFYMDILAFLD